MLLLSRSIVLLTEKSLTSAHLNSNEKEALKALLTGGIVAKTLAQRLL
ncbi:hypothetical protein YZOS03_32110 [Vibrio alginolyticus]|nr:hypothetical protein YZOS03_32110 [Vibrio alginolyticus]